jgi:murein L,D-transpeptidase YcbB/YkuD
MRVAMAWCMCLALMTSAHAQSTSAAHPDQARLQAALARYKSISDQGGWPLVPPGRTLKSGLDDPRVALLRRRLVLEGDLSVAAVEGRQFDPDLEAAVRRFQARHGLHVDGRVGPNTYRALNVTADRRLSQIAANLQRWRDVPTELPARRLEINIPTAELALLEDGRQIAGMRVVVGTKQNPTPLLRSSVIAVVFNPPWNVPVSIARNEILPRLARDPGYLRENDIRIADRPSDPYGEEINWSSPDRPRSLILQQQPGPRNALGRIKFDIPNAHAVYLHDTPNRTAFLRAARALSHGCVRLQDPESLARHVLRDRLRADPGLVDRALDSYQTTEIRVTDPLPVFIFYWTAFVTTDGRVNFRSDLYRLDVGPEPGEMAAASTTVAGAEGPACGGYAHLG